MERHPVRKADGTVVAHVSGEILYKKVKPELHMLRNPPAWAFDRTTIDQAKTLGATAIILIDDKTGRRWGITIKRFDDLYFEVNRGHGEQIAVALPAWQIFEPGVLTFNV